MTSPTTLQPSAPEAWIAAIDHYQLTHVDPQTKAESILTNEEAHKKVASILTTDNARKALYKGTTSKVESAGPAGQKIKTTPTKARKAFLDYLYTNVLNNPEKKMLDPINSATIDLEKLLDPEGMELYKAAIKEERESEAFRDAVFLKSTKHYEGEKWARRLVLPLGGPSASGKSVGADAAIKKVHEVMEKDPTQPTTGNDVVSVDGGVEREVSQMRQMVLQVALAKGYRGIEDLHSNTKLGIKKHVRAAAIETPGLSMVIPDTFTGQIKGYAMDKVTFGLTGGVARSKLKKYDELDDDTAIVAFGIVVAQKENVVKGGNGRAWNTTVFTPDQIKMNNTKLPCESKNYQEKYFSVGKKMSEEAMKVYQELDIDKTRITVTITSDYTFVKPKQGDPNQRWELADPDEPWTPEMVGISLRDFNKWLDYERHCTIYNQIKERSDLTPELRENLEKFRNEQMFGKDSMSFGDWLKHCRAHKLLSPPIIELQQTQPTATAQVQTQTSHHVTFNEPAKAGKGEKPARAEEPTPVFLRKLSRQLSRTKPLTPQTEERPANIRETPNEADRQQATPSLLFQKELASKLKSRLSPEDSADKENKPPPSRPKAG